MTDFVYDNVRASDYNLVPMIFNGSGGFEVVDFGSQFSNDFVNTVGTDENMIINNNYSFTLNISFQVGKFTCKDGISEITPLEYGEINRWLNRKESHKLKVVSDGYEDIYFVGRFNISAVKYNGKIMGLELNFISTYPYGFMDEETLLLRNIHTFGVIDESDEIGCIYPTVKIKCLEDGKLTITNSNDNEIFELDNCETGEVITIDSNNKIITSSNLTHKIYKDFNYNYIKICNTYNNRENIYNSSLNIDIELKYSFIRKVGV